MTLIYKYQNYTVKIIHSILVTRLYDHHWQIQIGHKDDKAEIS